MKKEQPPSLQLGRLRSPKEIEELKRQSDQQHRDAIERLRRAKEEARRRGVPLHQIIPVH